ncbi:sodium:proton antiporter [Kineobactrum sediminis]|uniref:Sodium:proton antiporter n=1 Tax=Kineobactrum sediminis TaxID=1905677 RepID=A0A2N5Y2C9_9GAMM|nr:sodium:proton antiporter [Kineobactrum sediminis]
MILGFFIWTALWALLSQNSGWVFGIPVAALATLAGYRLGLRSGPVRPQALPTFLVFFLRELFSGGVDVARRALHARLPIAPAWQIFTLTSRDPRVCLMLSALVGLLPGTLASHHKGSELYVHTLDQHRDWQSTVARLENLLSRLLGESQP